MILFMSRFGYGRNIVSEREERSTNIFDLDDYTDVYGKGGCFRRA